MPNINTLASATQQFMTPQQQQQFYMGLQNQAQQSGMDPYSILANTLQRYSMIDQSQQKMQQGANPGFIDQNGQF